MANARELRDTLAYGKDVSVHERSGDPDLGRALALLEAAIQRSREAGHQG